MKKNVRRLSFLIVVGILLLQLSPLVSAFDVPSDISAVHEFVQMLSESEPGFESWDTLPIAKAYDLYSIDEEVTGALYYVGQDGAGYVITDTNGSVLEFAAAAPAYDLTEVSFEHPIYQNGCYYVDAYGVVVQLYADGVPVGNVSNTNARTILDMEAYLQGSMLCQPTAIAHI